MIKVLPLKTAEEVVAKEKKRKARTTLPMALPEDHLAKFHKMIDAKEMWEAIKSKFGGNDKSKKMQKYLLKQQFKDFSVSTSEGLHKGYDRFQTLLSQLEIHGVGVSHNDANQKFLRSLPSFWSQVALIMRTKLGLDTLSFDDLYNNLRVFEHDVKEDIDWSGHVEEDTQNYAMMAYSSSNSGSDNEESDLEDTPVNDRFSNGMHAVLPPMTGSYMPSGPNVEIDYSKFTYGLKQTSADESDSKPSEYASCESDSSVETSTSMREPVENASKVTKNINAPFTDSVQHVKTSKENIQETDTTNHSPKIEKQNRNTHPRKGNKAHLADYQEFKSGSVAFGGSNRRITCKRKDKGWQVRHVSHPPGFVDLKFPNKVYKVVKALYGLHQAHRAWYATLSTFLENIRYRRGAIDKTLFIKQDKKDIMLVQVYVDDIIFGSTKKSWCNVFEELMKNRFQMSSMGELTFFLRLQTASTPIETQKPLVKDEKVVDVEVHLYRSMIGFLMYLTSSRPDIMFEVCACSRFQVNPKSSHLQAVNRIFRRLISWKCKKQTIMATSTTEAEYVVVAHCCGQVLWIQNQLLDYGFNFMNTKIYIDNESTICIVKNPAFHSKTKHIEIRHHFIRDAYEKKLIQVLKIHTDDNVANPLTKAFDVSRFKFLMGCDCYGDYLGFILLFGMKIEGYKCQINAKIAGKPVVITEASIRSDLLFNDVDGIDCLTNDAIFKNLALMGYVGDLTKLTFQKALFSPQWKFLIHTIIHCLSSKIAEGEDSRTPTESQPTPSPTQPSGTGGSGEDQVNLPHDSHLSGGHTSDTAEGSLNLEALSALCTNLSNKVLALDTVKDAQAKEILTLKARIKKLEKRCKPSISHHRAWLRSVSLLSKKKKLSKRKFVSKQGRNNAKSRLTKDDSDKLDAELDEDIECMDTEEALNEGRLSTVDTARPDSTDRAARSILTLKPLLIIDPKDKNKGNLEEPESAKKMSKSDFDAAQIARDEEIARQLEVELQTEYTVDERAKLLAEYFERKKKQLAEERVATIINKPPTKTQLRRLMMTYLKNMERRYPLTTRTLERMLSLRLIVESASDVVYDSLRFIQKQIDESGGHRGEKDL
nr:hypothetical protein [Tanacetum cinerariifolium]